MPKQSDAPFSPLLLCRQSERAAAAARTARAVGPMIQPTGHRHRGRARTWRAYSGEHRGSWGPLVAVTSCLGRRDPTDRGSLFAR
jgi:hypothetical protein